MFTKETERHSIGTASDLWISLRELLESRQQGSKYIWVYWDQLDSISHFHGLDSERAKAELLTFSAAFQRYFLDQLDPALKKDTLVILTAYHGQITTDKENQHYNLIRHPQFTNMLHLLPTGENRLAYLHIKPRRTEDVGLQATRKAVFRSIPWQLCKFHLLQNASQYVPRQSMKREVAADIRSIFNIPDREQAEVQLRRTVEKYARRASKLTDWMEGNIPEGLTIFAFPADHRRRIRTVNSLERICQEIRRRTRVARIFPSEASCLRLVSVLLMEISETWETGRIYLSFVRY